MDSEVVIALSVYVPVAVLIVITDGLWAWLPDLFEGDVLTAAFMWPLLLVVYCVTAPFAALNALHSKLRTERDVGR